MWFSEEGNLHPGMILECADLQRNLARAKLNNAGYPLEASGARVGRVLTEVGWPVADRDIDAGNENMIATGAIENVIAMGHLFDVQESELGNFWIKGNGYARFEERGARSDYTSQATFGTDELPIFDPVFPLDDELLYNEVRLTREGGTEQVLENSASILAHGLRTLSRSGLLVTTDVIVLWYCLYLLARHHAAEMRIKSFSVKPQTPGYEATLWPLVLGLEIGQKITLVWTEADISGTYFIEGIEHSWDYREGVWVTKFQCSNAEQYYMELDPTTETLRPNGVGASSQCSVSGDSPGWKCVDDEDGHDGDTTKVYCNDGVKLDLYALEDPPWQSGTIQKIIVSVVTKGSGENPANIYAYVRTHDTNYFSSPHEPPNGSYDTFNWEIVNNNNTGEAWTWAELVALQAGVRLSDIYVTTNCTQVYVTVYFTPGW